jgi:hypothetical protein
LALCRAINAGATCLPQHVGGFQPRLLERGLLLARNPVRDKVCGLGVVKAPRYMALAWHRLRLQLRFVYPVYTLAAHRLQGSQRVAAAGWEVLHDHKCRGGRHTQSGRGADSRDIEQHVSRRPGFARRMTDARDSSDERALHLAIENPGFGLGGSDRPRRSGVDCLPGNPRS